MCDLLEICQNEKVGSDLKDGEYPTRSALRRWGRYAKIKKNVPAGGEILSEMPFVVGPKLDSALCCLGCYRYMEEPALCEKCRWPICSPTCSDKTFHRDYECQVFAKSGVTYNVDAEAGPQFECIVPLRALLAKERQPDVWDSHILHMMDHNQLRQSNVELWEAEKINVVDFLRDKCQLADRFPEDLIRRLCGILEINSFEILPDPFTSVPIRGLYPKASTPSHNCVANTTHSIFPGDFRMVVRATVDLKEGEEIFCSYTSSLDATMVRRANLKSTKYFDCDCDRCKDPKELGSHLSSIKCPSCDNGLILSSSPLDPLAGWKCTHCDKALAGELVQRLYLKMQNELVQLEYMEPGPEKLELAEKLLRNYKSSLHPRHAANASIAHILIQLYGRVEGYTIDMLPDIILERKAQFGQQLLETLAIVEPGKTRMRGRLLFEIHACQLMMTRTKLQLKVINTEKFKQEVNQIISTLEETADILSLEPAGTPDYLLAQNAKDAAEQLTKSLEGLTELPE